MEHHIVIAGAGGIGKAVGLLLANYPEIQGRLFVGDRYYSAAASAVSWIREASIHPIEINAYEIPEAGEMRVDDIGKPGGVLLDCLPGSQAPRMAAFAIRHGMHYVNLTEHVAETEKIREMAADSAQGFVLQTGLAPGFINILARHLYEQFNEQYSVAEVDRLSMRVGALTDHTIEPHFYGFTWSPIGVATEYLRDSVVVRDGEITRRPALSEREVMIIDGIKYEADLTSGGAADLPYALGANVRNLDYKTLRYPGHYSWVESIISQHNMQDRQEVELEKAMLEVVPAVEDDLIIVYAAVEGRDNRGILRKLEKAQKIGPTSIGGKRLRAIQATTAAPMAECTRMLLSGRMQGIYQQSQIDTRDFLTGPFIERVYGKMLQRQEMVMGN